MKKEALLVDHVVPFHIMSECQVIVRIAFA